MCIVHDGFSDVFGLMDGYISMISADGAVWVCKSLL